MAALGLGALLLALLAPAAARAEKVPNAAAVFAFLDKVTARISKQKVEIGKTVSFGTLKVTPRACYTRPATEEPKTTSFVEVDDVKLDGSVERIFSGWMFAQSPGLHAVEHPVFDVWLTDCAGAGKPVASAAAAEPAAGEAASPEAEAAAAAEGGADAAAAEDPAAVQPAKKRRVKRQ